MWRPSPKIFLFRVHFSKLDQLISSKNKYNIRIRLINMSCHREHISLYVMSYNMLIEFLDLRIHYRFRCNSLELLSNLPNDDWSMFFQSKVKPTEIHRIHDIPGLFPTYNFVTNNFVIWKN